MKHSFGGPWTQIKLDLLRRYLVSFNTALKDRPSAAHRFSRIYIDAFAGTGECEIRTDEYSVETIAGSAKIALETLPAFDEIHLIDLNPQHIDELAKLAGKYTATVRIHHDDANIAVNNILQRNWRMARGVLFLDPYGMTVPWSTLERIASTRALDVWYLFPLSATYRQAANDFNKVDQGKSDALDAVLGTPIWRDRFYRVSGQGGLLEAEEDRVRVFGPEDIAEFVHERLRGVFEGWVSEPLYLRSTRGAPLFALYFCLANPAPKAVALARKMAAHILKHYGQSHSRLLIKSNRDDTNLDLFG